MPADVAVVILTFNEELNISQALRSVCGWAREVHVLDSGSTDKTAEIAASFNCTFTVQAFEDYAKQRNFALENLQIETEWVFFLDADEWLTEELKVEIASTIASSPGEDGFFVKRRFIWMSRWVRRGFYPSWILRLFRAGKGRCEERRVNEHIVVEGATGFLRNDLMHEDRRSIHDWIAKHNRYARLEAAEMLAGGATGSVAGRFWGTQVERKRWLARRVYYRLPLVLRPAIFFLYRYVLRGGFLDGLAGFTYNFLQAFWFTLLIDLSVIELRREAQARFSMGPLALVPEVGGDSAGEERVVGVDAPLEVRHACTPEDLECPVVFLGDVAIPFDAATLPMPKLPFNGSVTVANLEGAITNGSRPNLDKPIVFSDESVLDYLRRLNTRVVSLANNHLEDIGGSWTGMLKVLEDNGIGFCGAGLDLSAANEPAELWIGQDRYLFVSFGWGPIGCRAATKSKPGVNPLRPDHVLETISELRRRNPDAVIVALMHWNYELECYPQPMHRQLAHKMIDLGADAIVGSHSHTVQGVESHRGAPIVYGLGNWLIPQGVFSGGRLFYPPFVNRELAFGWDPRRQRFVCHWFEYQQGSHALEYLGSENAFESDLVRKATPFAGMSDEEYVPWFAAARVQRRMLPVYRRYDETMRNRLNDGFVTVRQRGIDLLVRLRLKDRPTAKEGPDWAG